ncbi:hypothetical protein AMJ44_07730 [candidate division WOR-1 bacterium DG_54_3]|uniref:Putative nickel insertion protein n=1 Tax=candidate division WOR-1 bacterium DG_54_3 TaxID=1703775 RepID=A0A0S7XWL9_UNCSA|nr:MAG: hypothetical protein AMJ44_07730 [candidate division WOR-1 bacterium DG_54_3]
MTKSKIQKIAYFDCPSGIAGNMILGALIDAGLSLDYLKAELNKLQINYKLQITKVKKSGIRGSHLAVKVKGREKPRTLKEIVSIIQGSKLSKKVKTLSSKIFKRLAEAEARVHGEKVGQVHLHDVGAIDAMVDIIGTVIGMEKLGIQVIYASPLPHGKGKIKHKHGTLPNPAPATAELLKNVPTYGTNILGELVTPTGAAIISTLANDFGDLPRMEVKDIGYGAGSLNLSIPNLLRIFVGEAQLPSEKDAVLQIETNLDDMNPRFYHKAISRLMKARALDAYTIPVMIKKRRAGVNLVVLCAPENRNQIITQIFDLTTTLGVRVYLVPREKLSRKLIRVKTKFGKARVKLGLLGKELKTIAPEFEDYKRIAKKHHVPIQKAYKEVKRNLCL